MTSKIAKKQQQKLLIISGNGCREIKLEVEQYIQSKIELPTGETANKWGYGVCGSL